MIVNLARAAIYKCISPQFPVRSPASSIRSLKYGTPSRPTTAYSIKQDFEVGDKVIVNGAKIGEIS